VLIPADDVGERHHSAHGGRRIGIGVEEFLPGFRSQLHGRLEPLDPKLPDGVAIAGIDGEQWTVAVGALHESARDTVVMLYDETENPVDFVKVVEGPAADLLYPDSR
jgi:hypothetical protein